MPLRAVLHLLGGHADIRVHVTKVLILGHPAKLVLLLVVVVLKVVGVRCDATRGGVRAWYGGGAGLELELRFVERSGPLAYRVTYTCGQWHYCLQKWRAQPI